MKRQLTGVMFFLIAVITCGLNVFFAPPVNAQVQGACASAPCDCTSVGGSSHPADPRWCNYQACYNQCMSEKRGGSAPKSGAGAAASGLSQPFYNLGYAIGDSIGKTLFGDPAQKARQEAEEAQRAQEAAQEAAMRRKWEEDQARIRAAEDARKRQEAYDRLSSQAPNLL